MNNDTHTHRTRHAYQYIKNYINTYVQNELPKETNN